MINIGANFLYSVCPAVVLWYIFSIKCPA